MNEHTGTGNLSGGERIGSALLGIGLMLLPGLRRGLAMRLTVGGIAGALMARAFAGHCAMKAAIAGDSSLRQGIADQWHRTTEVGRGIAQRASARGRGSMQHVEKTIDVARPVRTVYNQWTQFEEFPRFMVGVKEVQQIDDTHVHWRAKVWGKEVEWDAEITEQQPNKRISWKSVTGAPNAGTVRFEPLDGNSTRVRLVMAYQPQSPVENLGDMMGLFEQQVQTSVEQFKHFIESRGTETGGWQGQVDDSRAH